jgi:hypothetical protein
MVFPKKCAKSVKSVKSPRLVCRLAGHWRFTPRFGRQNGHGFWQAGCFRHSTWSAGDKRDDILFYALRIGERPVSHPASESSGLGLLTGGAVFPKLSKLLNQEDALSAPCLRGDFYSPHAARGAGILRKGFIDCFWCDITVCDHGVVILATADASQWWAADARVEHAGARPGRAVVARRRRCMNTYSRSSTVLRPRPRSYSPARRCGGTQSHGSPRETVSEANMPWAAWPHKTKREETCGSRGR